MPSIGGAPLGVSLHFIFYVKGDEMANIVLSQILSGYNMAEVNRNFTIIQDALNNLLLRKDGENAVLTGDLDVNGQTLLNVGDLEINGVSVLDGVTQIQEAYESLSEQLDTYSYKLQDIINKAIDSGSVDQNHTNNVQATWTLSTVGSVGSTLTLPYHYTVGKNTLRLSYNNLYQMYRNVDYTEVGEIGEQSNQITVINTTIPVGAVMEMWVDAESEMTQILEEVIEAKELLETYNATLINSFLDAVEQMQEQGLDTKIANATSAANNLSSQTSDANTLLAQIQSMINTINSNANQCATYYTQIAGLYEGLLEFQRGGIDLSALTSTLSEMQDNINTITSVQNATSTTYASVNNVNSSVTTMSSNVAAMSRTVSNYTAQANAQMTSLTTNYNTYRSNLSNTYNTEANALNSQYTRASSSLAALSTSAAGVLDSVVTEGSASIARMSQLSGFYETSMQNHLATASDYMLSASKYMSGASLYNNGAATSLTRISQMTSSVSTMSTAVSTNYIQVNTAKASVAAMTDNVEDMETNVATMSSNIMNASATAIDNVSSAGDATYSTVSTSLNSLNTIYMDSLMNFMDTYIVPDLDQRRSDLDDVFHGYESDLQSVASDTVDSVNAVSTNYMSNASSLYTSLTATSSNIATMYTSVVAMSNLTANTSQRVASIAGDVSTTYNNIASLSINTKSSDIENMYTSVSNIKNDVVLMSGQMILASNNINDARDSVINLANSTLTSFQSVAYDVAQQFTSDAVSSVVEDIDFSWIESSVVDSATSQAGDYVLQASGYRDEASTYADNASGYMSGTAALSQAFATDVVGYTSTLKESLLEASSGIYDGLMSESSTIIESFNTYSSGVIDDFNNYSSSFEDNVASLTSNAVNTATSDMNAISSDVAVMSSNVFAYDVSAITNSYMGDAWSSRYSGVMQSYVNSCYQYASQCENLYDQLFFSAAAINGSMLTVKNDNSAALTSLTSDYSRAIDSKISNDSGFLESITASAAAYYTSTSGMYASNSGQFSSAQTAYNSLMANMSTYSGMISIMANSCNDAYAYISSQYASIQDNVNAVNSVASNIDTVYSAADSAASIITEAKDSVYSVVSTSIVDNISTFTSDTSSYTNNASSYANNASMYQSFAATYFNSANAVYSSVLQISSNLNTIGDAIAPSAMRYGYKASVAWNTGSSVWTINVTNSTASTWCNEGLCLLTCNAAGSFGLATGLSWMDNSLKEYEAGGKYIIAVLYGGVCVRRIGGE